MIARVIPLISFTYHSDVVIVFDVVTVSINVVHTPDVVADGIGKFQIVDVLEVNPGKVHIPGEHVFAMRTVGSFWQLRIYKDTEVAWSLSRGLNVFTRHTVQVTIKVNFVICRYHCHMHAALEKAWFNFSRATEKPFPNVRAVGIEKRVASSVHTDDGSVRTISADALTGWRDRLFATILMYAGHVFAIIHGRAFQIVFQNDSRAVYDRWSFFSNELWGNVCSVRAAVVTVRVPQTYFETVVSPNICPQSEGVHLTEVKIPEIARSRVNRDLDWMSVQRLIVYQKH